MEEALHLIKSPNIAAFILFMFTLYYFNFFFDCSLMENRINKVGNESGNAINLYQNLINLKRNNYSSIVLWEMAGPHILETLILKVHLQSVSRIASYLWEYISKKND